MNLNDAIDIIESHEFSARLNAASNFNTVLKIAKKQEAVKALSNYLDDSINREKIFARIVELSKKNLIFGTRIRGILLYLCTYGY